MLQEIEVRNGDTVGMSNGDTGEVVGFCTDHYAVKIQKGEDVVEASPKDINSINGVEVPERPDVVISYFGNGDQH